ncbi:hypothetical protein [Micrococcus luteus]|nr:hypothetical protein [Micrococcus luteus]
MLTVLNIFEGATAVIFGIAVAIGAGALLPVSAGEADSEDAPRSL